MAWTIPRTWVANELVTAAIMNTHIRDDLGWLFQPPAVRVYNNANISITSGALTALTFNSERFDQAGGSASTQHDLVTNTGRLTSVQSGVYLAILMVEWAANSTGVRDLYIRANGTTTFAHSRIPVSTAGDTTFHSCSGIYQLNATEYIEALVTQNSGGALNVLASGNRSPEFMMVQVSG